MHEAEKAKQGNRWRSKIVKKMKYNSCKIRRTNGVMNG